MQNLDWVWGLGSGVWDWWRPVAAGKDTAVEGDRMGLKD